MNVAEVMEEEEAENKVWVNRIMKLYTHVTQTIFRLIFQVVT